MVNVTKNIVALTNIELTYKYEYYLISNFYK